MALNSDSHAHNNIADDLPAAGYSDGQIRKIRQDLDRFLKLREIIRMASGETIDLKAYEADMRHLIDTYIDASSPERISPFEDIPLLEVLVKWGATALIKDVPDRAVRPDDWRGIETRERVIKQALFQVLGDENEVERIFPTIKAQAEY